MPLNPDPSCGTYPQAVLATSQHVHTQKSNHSVAASSKYMPVQNTNGAQKPRRATVEKGVMATT